MELRQLIFSLLFSLCVGYFLTFGLLRRPAVGARYFRYHGLGNGVLALGAWVGIRPPGVDGWGALLFALLSGAFSLLGDHPRKGLAPALFGGATLAGGWGLWNLATVSGVSPLPLGLSALGLGLSMAAMLVGHWYLNIPGLNIRELRVTVLAFFAVLGVRTLQEGWALAPRLGGMSEADAYRFLLSSTEGIFHLMRWFWGLLGPWGLAYFVWDTVRLKSTQSATGILYVVVVFVLIGETIAQYLAFRAAAGGL